MGAVAAVELVVLGGAVGVVALLGRLVARDIECEEGVPVTGTGTAAGLQEDGAIVCN